MWPITSFQGGQGRTRSVHGRAAGARHAGYNGSRMPDPDPWHVLAWGELVFASNAYGERLT
jgi:hypothetical protein